MRKKIAKRFSYLMNRPTRKYDEKGKEHQKNLLYLNVDLGQKLQCPLKVKEVKFLIFRLRKITFRT